MLGIIFSCCECYRELGLSNNHDVEGPETEGAWTSATSLTFEPTALAVWFVKHCQSFE